MTTETEQLEQQELDALTAAFMKQMRSEGSIESVKNLLRENLKLKANCKTAADACAELEQMLEKLLEGELILYYVEGFRVDSHGDNRIAIRIGGTIRNLKVHPDLDEDILMETQPGHICAVNAREMIVVDILRDPDLLMRSQGEVVEFKEYLNQDEGLVLVNRAGRGEEVICLVPELCTTELKVGSSIITSRESDHWGVAHIHDDDMHRHCQYEINIESLDVGFEDLAGLDQIKQQTLQEVLTRIAFPEKRARFDLEKLSGMILHSRPGMGKTVFAMAAARELWEIGKRRNLDVFLYSVPPHAFKSKWHGDDAKNVRALQAAIDARCRVQDGRRKLGLILFDELDSVGMRSGGGDGAMLSSAQNDVVQAMLDCMDGIKQKSQAADLSSEILWMGLTNWLEGVDPALRRPERFGNVVLEMPSMSFEMAEGILAVNTRKKGLPFHVDGQILEDMSEDAIRTRVLRPALAEIYERDALTYTTEGQRRNAISAGQLLSGAHIKNAATKSKRLAACRDLQSSGIPALCIDDLIDALIDEAVSVGKQYISDRKAMRRDLKIEVPIATVDLVPESELRMHRYIRRNGH